MYLLQVRNGDGEVSGKEAVQLRFDPNQNSIGLRCVMHSVIV